MVWRAGTRTTGTTLLRRRGLDIAAEIVERVFGECVKDKQGLAGDLAAGS
jgi:hypothetical protein